jgi:hypothetical protein
MVGQAVGSRELDATMMSWCAAYPLSTVALCAAVVIAVGIAMRGGLAGSLPRSTASLGLFVLGACGLAAAAAVALATDGRDSHWGDLLALVPPTLVVRHAVYLRLIRRRGMSGQGLDLDEFQEQGFPEKRFGRIFARARAANDREFGTDVIAWRYGVPALTMAIVGVAAFELLSDEKYWRGPSIAVFAPQYVDSAWRGARFAAAGAYAYALLYLGQRSLRRDLSSGAATWAMVTLAAGPLAGGTLALLWNKAPGGGSDWTFDSIYFVAGFSPRYASAVVNEAVRRLWLTRAGGTADTSLCVPLTQLRGVTVDVADRLEEEGITDAVQLAYADPLKLYRNTAYDKRQILAWIDEALLLANFAQHWQDLRSADVTGVIDLAARYAAIAEQPPAAGDPFDLLAKAVGKDGLSADVLREKAALLYEDAQVGLVWALYQVDDDGTSADFDGPRVAVASGVRPRRDGQQPPRTTLAWVGSALALIALGFASSYALRSAVLPLSRASAACVAFVAFLGAGVAFLGRASSPLPSALGRRSWIVAGVLAFVVAAAGVGTTAYVGALPALTIGASIAAVSAAAVGWTVARIAVATWATVRLTLDVTPAVPGTTLAIDGQRLNGTSVDVKEGTHILRAECPRYVTQEIGFSTSDLRGGRVAVALEPMAPTGALFVVEPAWVTNVLAHYTVLATGQVVGLSGSRDLTLPPGAYLFSAQAPDFKPAWGRVTLRDGEHPTVVLQLEPDDPVVTVIGPAGSTVQQVTADGVMQSGVQFRLAPGPHVLMVTVVDPVVPGQPPVSRQIVRNVVLPRAMACAVPL